MNVRCSDRKAERFLRIDAMREKNALRFELDGLHENLRIVLHQREEYMKVQGAVLVRKDDRQVLLVESGARTVLCW